MISDVQKEYLIEELVKRISLENSPRQTLATLLAATSVPQSLTQGMPRELVMSAVQLCLKDGWGHSPPWISLLLVVLPETDTLVEIRASLSARPPLPPDPMNATILSTGAPFVNRSELRRHVRRLATEAARAQPILVVNGGPKLGKSYSAAFLDHFSQQEDAIVTHHLQLDPDTAQDTGPEEVARDLVWKMGRSVDGMPRPQTNKKRYVQDLANWVLNEAARSDTRHWFVMDNFQGDLLRADTRDLLVALSSNLLTGVYTSRCRLILLGFDRSTLTVDSARVEAEEVEAADDAEIEACIGEIMRRVPRAFGHHLARPCILEDLPNGQERMSEVNLRLRALLKAVQQVHCILDPFPALQYEPVLLKILENLPDGKEREIELDRRLKDLADTVGEA